MILLFLLSGQVLSAQSKEIKSLKSAYQGYFESKPEAVYLHLNKTRYVQGENIFFKAYLFDQRSLGPLPLNRNLFLRVYDSQGIPMQTSMWEIKNGISYGNIQIDSAFTHGNYYIKGFTRGMREFDRNSGCLIKIEILEYDSEGDDDPGSQFGLRMIPEGGNYIADMVNKIGFQAVDENGKGLVVARGTVRDSSGKVVADGIKSNAFGLGKFDLFLKSGASYSCEFELKNGHKVGARLTEFKNQGFMINISGGLEKTSLVSVRTNDATLKKEKGKKLYLAIHRDGAIKLVSFKLNEKSKSFKVEKENLKSGVNIISLLDQDLNLLTKRVFFNHQGLDRIQIESKIVSSSSTKDTVYLELRTDLLANEKINLSVSINPEESVSNLNPFTIGNGIWFKRHLDARAEISPYYFQSFDRKTLFDIDLLFLVHGRSDFIWSGLNRKARIRTSSDNYGISMKGTIENKKREKIKSVLLFQEGVGMMQSSDIEPNGSFSFKNAPILKGEMLKFLLMDEKNKTRKPEITLDYLNLMETDSIVIESLVADLNPEQVVKLDEENLKRSFLDKRIELDNIDLIAKAPEEEVTRNSNLTIGYWNAEKITAEDHKKYPKLSTYLRRLGFKVRLLGPGDLIFVDARKTLDPIVKPPVIYENGFRLTEPLRNYPLQNIDEIYYEHVGLRESSGGSIYIYTKAGGSNEEPSLPFTNLMAEEGFEKPLVFKNPYESDDMDEMMRKYMNVHWEPNLSRSEEGKLYIRFPRLGLNNFTIHLEGISENGALISETKTLMLEDDSAD